MSVIADFRDVTMRITADVRAKVMASKKTMAIFIAAVVAVATLGGAATVVALGGGGSVPVVGFDEERAMGFERDLVAMGPRWSGTANEQATAEYVAEHFRMAGLKDVKIEDYGRILWEVNTAQISIVPYNPLGILPSQRESPIAFEHKSDFVVQGYSGSRSSPNFRWDLLPFVVSGAGNNVSDFSGGSGRVCIVDWKEASIAGNTVLFNNAFSAGCAALLAHNLVYAEHFDYIPISKGTAAPTTWPNSSYPDIPFVAMSKAMGESIKSHTGWKIRINLDVTIEERTIHVVTGDVKGTVDPSKFVMLGAHHDNVYVNEGAVDDAVGTATIIELAHQLAGMAPKYTIRLATFGGEEQGLYGSLDWRDAHMDEVNGSMIAMLQFDMNHVDIDRCKEVAFLSNDNATLPILQTANARVRGDNPGYSKYEAEVVWADTSRMGSDMASFAAVNKTALFAVGCGSWEYHTYLDSLDRVKPESLAYTGKVFAGYAVAMANR
jgi:hypothetical protein